MASVDCAHQQQHLDSYLPWNAAGVVQLCRFALLGVLSVHHPSRFGSVVGGLRVRYPCIISLSPAARYWLLHIAGRLEEEDDGDLDSSMGSEAGPDTGIS